MHGIEVRDRDHRDSILKTTVTDSEGRYTFESLPTRLSSFYLQISQPQGYLLTKNIPTQCYPSSDYNQKSRKTNVFQTTGFPDLTFDAGLVEGITLVGRGG